MLAILTIAVAQVRARDPLLLRRLTTPGASAPAVVFIVLDTVRADKTSLCEMDKPTTPHLEALAKRGSHSCRAYSPGSWTVATHATWFTGEPVDVHRADRGRSDRTFGPVHFQGLGGDLPTVAEVLAERGYQTLSVSGNPIVSEVSGLTRGFDTVVSAPAFFGDLDRARLVPALEARLLDLDPERPLFLYVNIADAHAPYKPIRKGHPWLRPQKAYNPPCSEDEPPDLERMRRGYLADLQRADAALGDVLGLLEQRGWMGPETRLLVTSDHGEHLGEHGLICHQGELYEETQRVFLVQTGPGQVPVSEPMSTTVVYEWLLDLPAPDRPIEAISLGGMKEIRASAARWKEAEKHHWREVSGSHRIDLESDPEERRPIPLTEGMEALRQRVEAAAPESEELDPELVEHLRAAGYVE